MREDMWMMSAAAALSGLVHVGLMMGLMIVAAAVIRKHRPDAWLAFLVAPLVNIAGYLVLQTLTLAAGPISARSGGSYGLFHAGTTLLSACVSVAFWVVMFVGLARLARPLG